MNESYIQKAKTNIIKFNSRASVKITRGRTRPLLYSRIPEKKDR